MAVIAGTENRDVRGLSVIFQWVMAAADTAAAIDVSMFREMSVQVLRVSGLTDTCAIQGSNDNTNFVVLNSQTQTAGADKALTALTNSIDTIREHCKWVKPVKSGSTDPITVTLLGIPRN